MEKQAPISQGRRLHLFLNISFLFLLSFYLTTLLYPSNPHLLHLSKSSNTTTTTINPSQILNELEDQGCSALHKYPNYKAKCSYVKSEKSCKSEGYIQYLHLFYCNCGQYPILGYTLLILWLILLFYLLGNTAANYFCSSLESLSKILKLSPTIAGVTLLSLGNGAPDVFASIASFAGDGTGDVGLNSILGGAFFVSSAVVGIISISIGPSQISVDKSSFIRDILFFLFSLTSLLLIIIFGRINLWGALAFVSLYFVYVFVVSTTHFCKMKGRELNLFDASLILPITKKLLADEKYGFGDPGMPLLGCVDDEKPISIQEGILEDVDQKGSKWCFCVDLSSNGNFVRVLNIIELPLYLPRRMTIPVVCEETWSKPYAVISVTLAPILLVTLWNSQKEDVGSEETLIIYIVGGLAGAIFGILALVTTHKANPPKRCLVFWLTGGFLMSITWTYIIAEELVSLLISLGTILGISHSILGLTVLAWGNSLGDLIANLTMAMNGGPDGVQVAISGCYAGPIFNTLMGLGVSLVFSAWSEYPSSYIIPRDPSLYETLGFLMSGLLWALIILPKKNMKFDRFLGVGLLTIYLCFLFVRFAMTLGSIQLD